MKKVWIPQFLPFHTGTVSKTKYEIHHDGTFYLVRDLVTNECRSMTFREWAALMAKEHQLYCNIGHDEFTRCIDHTTLRTQAYLNDVNDAVLYGVNSKQVYQWQNQRLLLDGQRLTKLPDDRYIISPLQKISECGWVDNSALSDKNVARIAKCVGFTAIGGILGWTLCSLFNQRQR